MSFVPRHHGPRWLVCLDLEGRPEFVDPMVLMGCRRAIATARTRGWRLVHLYRGAGSGRDVADGVRALPGLSPLASETVLMRPALSAFSSAVFREQARAAPGLELAIVAADMAAAGLATGLAAEDLGLAAVLLRDAFPDAPALRAVDTLLADRGGRLSIAPLSEFSQPEEGLAFKPANQP